MAVLLAAGLAGACTAEDPLARPLPQPTMPAPAPGPDGAQPPLPRYVQPLDKPAISVKVDPKAACEDEESAAGGMAEGCR